MIYWFHSTPFCPIVAFEQSFPEAMSFSSVTLVCQMPLHLNLPFVLHKGGLAGKLNHGRQRRLLSLGHGCPAVNVRHTIWPLPLFEHPPPFMRLFRDLGFDE